MKKGPLSEGKMLKHLKMHLKGKTIILGIGNTLRSDDGVGAVLAGRLEENTQCLVFNAGVSPENYLGRIIKEEPDNLVIIDAVDFGGRPGEFRVMEEDDLRTVNLFSTHNSSLSLVINYLKSNIRVDIIILIIQPKDISFGDSLSSDVEETVDKLEEWFYESAKKSDAG